MRARRRFSARTIRARSVMVVPSGWASATSACCRIVAIGDRSSCDVSATSWRCRVLACSRRASIAFIVSASRLISSDPGGSGTRR